MVPRILRATQKDISALSRIYFAAFSRLDSEWTPRTASARVRQAVMTHSSWCFKLVEGREPIGLLLAERFDFAKGKCVYLADIAVKQGRQRRGLGRKLVKFLLRIARRRGCKGVYLNSYKKTMGFYRGLGFRETGHANMALEL